MNTGNQELNAQIHITNENNQTTNKKKKQQNKITPKIRKKKHKQPNSDNRNTRNTHSDNRNTRNTHSDNNYTRQYKYTLLGDIDGNICNTGLHISTCRYETRSIFGRYFKN